MKLRSTTRFPFLASPLAAWGAVILCTIFTLQAVLFFVWVPGLPLDWGFALPVILGAGLALIAGELLIRRGKAAP